MKNKNIHIYAIDEKGNERIIDDLYFFEEQGIRDLSGEGHYEIYKFRVEIELSASQIIKFMIDNGHVYEFDLSFFLNPKLFEAKE